MFHLNSLFTPSICPRSYQNSVGVLSAEGKGDAVNEKLDGLCERHRRASPVVVLHGHVERLQPLLPGTQSHQLVHTRALEVKLAAVKGAVVRVTRGGARGVTDGCAGSLSVYQRANLLGGAGGLAAVYQTQGGIAFAETTALLVGPEALAWFVVAALVGAPTPFLRHADATAESITLVTHTGLNTVTGANLSLVRKWTGGLARAGAFFVMAMTWTVHS